MRQRIADALQVAGAIGLVVAAGMFNIILGIGVGGLLAIVVGVLVAP